MNKFVILLSLVALTFAQDSDYAPEEGEEYHPEEKAAPPPVKETVVEKETVVVKPVVVKPVVVKPVHHTIGAEARRVNHINGRRQHYVNVKAVEYGASAGTAPEYGVPGTGVYDGYYDGDYKDGGYYAGDYKDGGYYERDYYDRGYYDDGKYDRGYGGRREYGSYRSYRRGSY